MNPIHGHLRAFCNIRMGSFTQSWHSLLFCFVFFGLRFRERGLRDLAIESGVIREGSLKAVSGKTYNSALQLHKYIYVRQQ